ncbi:hypothetical protein [Burkholderia sp. L27(2015)]|uniref:hypothetical protein n=1 Tax=Burkholderia sp. L27(2015) TaxID=1641858 RepID=UPI00131D4112|nr:hypothetical protein [Burkholderia sp. L27(2015)]
MNATPHSLRRVASLLCLLAVVTQAHAVPPDPGAACVRALDADPELQPLAQKTPLAFPSPRRRTLTLAMQSDPRKVDDDDKPLVSAWTQALQHCFELGRDFRAHVLTPESQAILQSQQNDLEDLLGKLYAGELSYGDFNRARQDIYDKHAEQASSTAQKMLDDRAAQALAAQQATLDAQRHLGDSSNADDTSVPGVPGVPGMAGYSAGLNTDGIARALHLPAVPSK